MKGTWAAMLRCKGTGLFLWGWEGNWRRRARQCRSAGEREAWIGPGGARWGRAAVGGWCPLWLDARCLPGGRCCRWAEGRGGRRQGKPGGGPRVQPWPEDQTAGRTVRWHGSEGDLQGGGGGPLCGLDCCGTGRMCAHALWEGYRPVVSGGQSFHSIPDGRNWNAAPEEKKNTTRRVRFTIFIIKVFAFMIH